MSFEEPDDLQRGGERQYAPGTPGAIYEEHLREGMSTLSHLLYRWAPAFVIAAIITWVVWQAFGAIATLIAVVLLAWVLVRLAFFKGSFSEIFARKVREWANDFRALSLWVKLALKTKKDARDTAAMAQQHFYLVDRAASPFKVFTILPLVLGCLGIMFGGFMGWKAEHYKGQRDQARDRAFEWQAQAESAEAAKLRLNADIGNVRMEVSRTIEELQAEQTRQQHLRDRERARYARTDNHGADDDFADELRDLAQPASADDPPPPDAVGDGVREPAAAPALPDPATAASGGDPAG